jgi:SPP1 family phage portal protein
MVLIFDIDANREILTKVFSNFQRQYHINVKMYLYYMGITDTNRQDLNVSSNGSYDDIYVNEYGLDAEGAGNYSYVNDRYDKRINTNFIKKFLREEVSYSVGNDITYTSHKGDDKIIELLRISTAHWKADHDATLCKNMLIYSIAYELYYIDTDAQFCSRVISPRHGIAYVDPFDNIIFFLHIFRQPYDTKMYVDVYTDSEIIHCDEVFSEISRTSHPFGRVPVGIATASEEGWLDSLYKDIKTLQDAYETNLSDISSEITEFRNAYLILNNLDLSKDDLPEMKKQGIMKTKGRDGSASWLIKAINDTFIQNTLTTLEDKMFQIACHINSNEKMSANTSSLALRARLISLEEKCKLNQKALANCVKTRLEMLLIYMNNLKNTNYDYRDIKVKFTPNIPSDDLTNSTVVTALGDKLSNETALSLFSFVDNPSNEVKKAKEESKANSIGAALLAPPVPVAPPVMPAPPEGTTMGMTK